ncbi:GNAT family N-acetyltransferase [Streptomyces sp. NPDC048644]|uniref:GNAT family N-acetyltransferase n=1 Tax=Streptomyces sp. NPDC048644 TaxID=3365582 RepID=UPI00370FB05B
MVQSHDTSRRAPAGPAHRIDAASDACVDAWCAVLAAAHAHDRPDLPAPERAAEAGRLRIPALHSRAAAFAVPAPGGGYAGVALVRLFDSADNTHTAFLDALTVHPRHRGAGVGGALWAEVRALLAAESRTSVSAQLDAGGPGEVFARSQGAVCALPLVAYVQDVTRAPADGRPALPDGYRFLAWSGQVPDAYADTHARAHQAMDDAPTGDLDARPDPWDAARVRAAAQVVIDRGGVLLTVAALATTDDSVAAYTELVLPTPRSVRALQYDTVVLPAHRGRGIGRAVKLRMREVLHGAHPGVREIMTTVADDNTPMRAVNAALGYRPEGGLGVHQLRL